jgi:hypothetical protein
MISATKYKLCDLHEKMIEYGFSITKSQEFIDFLKPKPKPNVEIIKNVFYKFGNLDQDYEKLPNVKFTFDGDTHVLISVEMIK